MEGAYGRFGRLGREIGVAQETDGDKEASERFLKAVVEICRTCEIPTLKQYGIAKERFREVIGKMAEDAMASGSPSNTRKEIKTADVTAIYDSLYE